MLYAVDLLYEFFNLISKLYLINIHPSIHPLCFTIYHHYLYHHDLQASKEMRAMNHLVVRKVATEMLRCKGKLLELMRAEDITKTGR